MRGLDATQEGLFVTRTTADCVPEGHPLRAIREILNEALRAAHGKPVETNTIEHLNQVPDVLEPACSLNPCR